MTTHAIVTMAIAGAFVAYWLYRASRQRAAAPDTLREFLARTGYRYADIPEEPLEAQVLHGQALASRAGGRGYRIHMIRDFHGLPIHLEQATEHGRRDGGRQVSTTAAWWMPLARTAAIRLQVAERSFGGATKALKELVTSHERTWSQRYPVRVEVGDRELDERFAFFGIDEGEVRSALGRADVRDLLLGLAEVDLCVHEDRVVLSDPLQRNVAAASGGALGQLALGTDPARRVAMAVPVHDRIAELLVAVGQACEPPAA
jgi:hypothetical protein